MEPIKLKPAFKDYLWGGTRLRDDFGKDCDFDKIAEYISLAVTDFENKKDYILNGVAEICAKYPLYE